MAELKIKSKYMSTKVAFGASAKTLGSRTDLRELAIMALQSNNPTLLEYFESIPTLEELQKEKVNGILAKIPANTEAAKSNDAPAAAKDKK